MPRRALWVIVPVLLLHFVLQASGFCSCSPRSPQSGFEGVVETAQVLIVLVLLFILGCQVYRYRRVSTREEKQQTKWFSPAFIFYCLVDVERSFGRPFKIIFG